MERVSALVRRELRRITANKSWLVMMLVQPVAYVVLFALALSGQLGGVTFPGRELSYLAFILPGLVALQTSQLFHVLVSLSSADRGFGVFSLVMMAGTKPWEYVVAEVISHGLVVAMQGILILIIGLPLMGKTFSLFVSGTGMRAGTAFVAWLGSLILWSTAGLMIGLRIEREEKRDVLWALLNLPLMLSSSVFYDVQRPPLLSEFSAMPTHSPIVPMPCGSACTVILLQLYGKRACRWRSRVCLPDCVFGSYGHAAHPHHKVVINACVWG
ncbi:MAG: ABC transporter permease [Candidatus Oleimicrobiaceae bacterium]